MRCKRQAIVVGIDCTGGFISFRALYRDINIKNFQFPSTCLFAAILLFKQGRIHPAGTGIELTG